MQNHISAIRKNLLPLIALCASFLCWDFFAFVALDAGIGSPEPVAPILGVMLAQAGFTCVIGGLCSRSWVKSLGIASLLGIAGCFVFLIGTVRYNVDSLTLLFILVPAWLFAGTMPLLLYRFFSGRCLTTTLGRSNEKMDLSLESLFTVTAVVAAQMVLLTTWPRTFQSSAAEILIGYATCGLVSFLLSAVGVLPVTVYYFNAKTGESRGRWLVSYGGLGVVASLVVTLLLGASAGPLPSAVFVAAMIFSIVSCMTFSIALVILRASGFRLTEPRSLNEVQETGLESVAAVDPFADPDDMQDKALSDVENAGQAKSDFVESGLTKEPVSEALHIRRTNRRWAIGFVLVSVLINFAASSFVEQPGRPRNTAPHIEPKPEPTIEPVQQLPSP